VTDHRSVALRLSCLLLFFLVSFLGHKRVDLVSHVRDKDHDARLALVELPLDFYFEEAVEL